MPCNARLFEEHFRVFRQRDEGFRRFIKGENFAAFNVVYPAVQAKRVITQAHRDGRVGLDIAELRKDVFLHHRIHFIDRLIPAFLLYHGFCRVGIAQPVRYSRHRLQVRVIGNRLHRAAVGVTADHDVGHAQRHYRVLDSCRDAAWLRPERWNNVASITNNKELSRLLLGDQFRDQTAVGAGDKQRFGILAGR